jgi:hypothetical protein
LQVTVRFPDGTEPERNELSWSVNRHAPYTLAFEYDAWDSTPLKRTGKGTFAGTVTLAEGAHTVEIVSTHTHTLNQFPLSVSSLLQRMELR